MPLAATTPRVGNLPTTSAAQHQKTAHGCGTHFTAGVTALYIVTLHYCIARWLISEDTYCTHHGRRSINATLRFSILHHTALITPSITFLLW